MAVTQILPFCLPFWPVTVSLSGTRVEAGATVTQSIVCEGAVVRRNATISR